MLCPKIGDVVRLRSGGPQMTVVKVASLRNRVTVVWFEADYTDPVYLTVHPNALNQVR